MPYLSKIRINPMRETGRTMLANPHRVHAMVQRGIPDQPVTERTLWRWEHPDPRQPHLLVLTQSRPDWTHIAEQAGWPNADGEHFTTRDYAPLFAHLAIGRRFAFKLTANPVQNTNEPLKPSPQQAERRAANPKRRSDRLGHRTAPQQLTWLLAKQERCGFTIPTLTLATAENPDVDADLVVPDVRISTRNRLTFKKRGEDPNPITLNTATYEGTLTVTNPTTLRNTLTTGLGPAKSYGCGLLTLAPLTEHTE